MKIFPILYFPFVSTSTYTYRWGVSRRVTEPYFGCNFRTNTLHKGHWKNQFHSNTALLKTAIIVQGLSITTSEQEQAELFAPKCINKQAAAIFISNEVKEFFFKNFELSTSVYCIPVSAPDPTKD